MALKRDERYPNRFELPTPEQPQGAFKNRSTDISKDGSYIERDWANDWSGFFSAALNKANIVPNGEVDTALQSQYYQAFLQYFYNPENKPTLADLGAAAASHTHTIANVNGLQSALDGKAPTSHTHSISQITSLQSSLDGKFDKSGGQATYFLPTSTPNGGNTRGLVKGEADSATLTGNNLRIETWFGFGIWCSQGTPRYSHSFDARTGHLRSIGDYYAQTDKRVYHQGFKPSAADVGAYAKSETYTQAEVNSRLVGKAIGHPKNLTNENLNDIKTAGVYVQQANANTSTALNYPALSAGSLIVYAAAGVVQEYRVYNNSLRYSRAQYSNGDWTPWVLEYNQKYKPAPSEIGAMASDIGNTSAGIPFQGGSITSRGRNDCLDVAGRTYAFATASTGVYLAANSYWDGAWKKHDNSKSSYYLAVTSHGPELFYSAAQNTNPSAERYVMYHTGNKPTPSAIGAYTQSECNARYLTGMRLGTVTSFTIHYGAGFNDKAGYVITAVMNTNSDNYVDQGRARPLQYALNGTWYTCASV